MAAKHSRCSPNQRTTPRHLEHNRERGRYKWSNNIKRYIRFEPHYPIRLPNDYWSIDFRYPHQRKTSTLYPQQLLPTTGISTIGHHQPISNIQSDMGVQSPKGRILLWGKRTIQRYQYHP